MVVVGSKEEDWRYSGVGNPKPKLPKAQVVVVG
jgi:hypothetical protein